ncbi:MAG: DoxX family protein [Candidatus Acidiferrales bacterium]
MLGLEKLKPLGLLFLRLGLGAIFISHGYAKLANIHNWMANFQHMGFPSYFAYLAGIIEFFGGIMLVAGLFTRLAGLIIAVEMAIAILRVHIPMGPITQIRDYEFPMALAVGTFALATLGAGLISFDHIIFGARGARSARKTKG